MPRSSSLTSNPSSSSEATTRLEKKTSKNLHPQQVSQAASFKAIKNYVIALCLVCNTYFSARIGVKASAGGLEASAGGLEASAGGLEASAGGLEASAGGLEASAAGGLEASAGGLEASAGGLEASAAGGLEASAGGVSLTFNSVPTPTGLRLYSNLQTQNRCCTQGCLIFHGKPFRGDIKTTYPTLFD